MKEGETENDGLACSFLTDELANPPVKAGTEKGMVYLLLPLSLLLASCRLLNSLGLKASLVLDAKEPALLKGVDVAGIDVADDMGDVAVDNRADLTALRRDRGDAEVAVVGDINVRNGGPFKSVR